MADDSFNGKILVTVHIEEEYEKTLNIAASHIQIEGVPEGYTVQLSEEAIVYTIRVKGLRADVDAIDAANLYGTIDVADFTEDKGWSEPVPGIYETDVEIVLPADITIEGRLEAYIEIIKLEEVE